MSRLSVVDGNSGNQAGLVAAVSLMAQAASLIRSSGGKLSTIPDKGKPTGEPTVISGLPTSPMETGA